MFLNSYMYKQGDLIELIIIRQFDTPYGRTFKKKYVRHFKCFETASAFQQMLM